jgi:hypothetical protein
VDEPVLHLAQHQPVPPCPSIQDAVPAPGSAAELAEQESSLRNARQWVKQARDQQRIGLYEAADPLRLLPFELRFLARRQPPDRWVVDLGASNTVLLPPQVYFQIPNPEDRLFVPAEYVPLWEQHGLTPPRSVLTAQAAHRSHVHPAGLSPWCTWRLPETYRCEHGTDTSHGTERVERR